MYYGKPFSSILALRTLQVNYRYSRHGATSNGYFLNGKSLTWNSQHVRSTSTNTNNPTIKKNMEKDDVVNQNVVNLSLSNHLVKGYQLRSKLFIPTLYEIPSDAVLPSHQLLLRGGYIRKSSHGIHTFLPLALRVLSKLENLIDKEMTNVGCSKVLMPTLTSGELWKKSGRWQSSGEELIRLQDRREDHYCLSPTHEEVITHMISSENVPRNHLPIKLYQISKKFRDEIRPRFGLLRSREFIMKDAYTFDATSEEAVLTYNAIADAYDRILQQIGAPYVKVEADTGNIGGSLSHEFQILSKFGEDSLLQCENCGYASNVEKASSQHSMMIHDDDDVSSSWTLDDLFNGKLPLTYEVFLENNNPTCHPIVAWTIPNREINVLQVQATLGCKEIRVLGKSEASRVMLQQREHSKQWKYIIDSSIKDLPVIQTLLNTFENSIEAKITLCQKEDPCFHCNHPLQESKGIEVGHVFYLGTKYSKIFNATYLDSDQKLKVMEMGCYGIGITRLLSAVVESFHDEQGIKWPELLAPYKMVVMTAGGKKQDMHVIENAHHFVEQLLDQMPKLKDELVLDDRWNERIGKKLTEAELIGYSWIIILGKSFIKEGKVEVKNRHNKTTSFLSVDQLIQLLQ